MSDSQCFYLNEELSVHSFLLFPQVTLEVRNRGLGPGAWGIFHLLVTNNSRKFQVGGGGGGENRHFPEFHSEILGITSKFHCIPAWV